jgi:predicted nucleic acid-binding Zn ribbon protein
MHNAVMSNKSNCIVCGSTLHGKQTMFCSQTCKNRHHQSYAAQKDRGLARKLELVRAAGGRCSVCGYNRNLAALAFHHSDSDEKDFKLDMRALSNRTLKSVLTELEKCILVCQNCHAELHNPHLDMGALR